MRLRTPRSFIRPLLATGLIGLGTLAGVGTGSAGAADGTWIIRTVAGVGTYGTTGDGGVATAAQLQGPTDLAFDSAGNMYITEIGGRVLKLTAATGNLATIADLTPSVLGSVVVDTAGNVYVSDSTNNKVIKLTTGTYAQTVVAGVGTAGYSGDDGLATAAELSGPWGLALDLNGNLYIADLKNDAVRKVAAADGKITTYAAFKTPDLLAIDSAGNIYATTWEDSKVRRIAASDKAVTVVAGNSDTPVLATIGNTATTSGFFDTAGIAIDSTGALHIAEYEGQRILRIDPTTKILSRVAGDGTRTWSEEKGRWLGAYGGDGGAASAAKLDRPDGLRFDGAGNLYVADLGNNRIRKMVKPLADSGGAPTRMLPVAFVLVGAGGVLLFADRRRRARA